jgi:hypothetical protein
MALTTEFYVLPAVEGTDDTTGETYHDMKYRNAAAVVRVEHVALVPAPGSFPGTATPDGKVYLASITADEADHATIGGSIDDGWAVGTGPEDDVTPEQARDYLNAALRPQSAVELVRREFGADWETVKASREEYRDLSVAEWMAHFGFIE